jgi:hypothetical protein
MPAESKASCTELPRGIDRLTVFPSAVILTVISSEELGCGDEEAQADVPRRIIHATMTTL